MEPIALECELIQIIEKVGRPEMTLIFSAGLAMIVIPQRYDDFAIGKQYRLSITEP